MLWTSELEQLVPAAVDSICGDWPEPGRGGALQLVEALTWQGFRVGPDSPAATAAVEAQLLPLVLDDIDLITAGQLRPQTGELPYLAGSASCLAAIGLRLPEQQLAAICSYNGRAASRWLGATAAPPPPLPPPPLVPPSAVQHNQATELPYLAFSAGYLAAVGLRPPEPDQLAALCGYVEQHRPQLRDRDRRQLQRAFDAWGYQPGLALLRRLAPA
ncbi:5-enolpyruvylshikimate-3-phosphate synthase [Chlorella sorokiniana]|uniref:5-enolpyruvylshikimate-3-phosphate synthase n=1 Tax=Chlorella sorokiniana TaxID=3076 RepID=A0A2P6U342_CHLSO|nr:5-enolpyruvylshikimate-3-phosphate synthase [Chlorella sorokiniana]|eukprot:PRW60733.1 5-enolpyruvylshikimate-3-phosphate synthase [Chlorella sorokiniana]